MLWGLKFLVLVVVGVALVGCVAAQEAGGFPSNHPANPSAQEAAAALPTKTLAIGPDETTSPAPTTTTSPQDANHAGHGGHRANATPGAASSAAEPAATQAAYACPMHPEVTSATPGKCPKCGMDLKQTGGQP